MINKKNSYISTNLGTAVNSISNIDDIENLERRFSDQEIYIFLEGALCYSATCLRDKNKGSQKHLDDLNVSFSRTIYGAFTRVFPSRGLCSYSDVTKSKARTILLDVNTYGFTNYTKEEAILCFLISKSKK